MAARHLDDHVDNKCTLRFTECPEQCGARVCIADMAFHRSSVCKFRRVTCRWKKCGKKMRECDRMSHEEHCKKRLVPCGLGCGEHFQLPLIDAHRAKECPKRMVRCTREMCIRKVRASTLPSSSSELLFIFPLLHLLFISFIFNLCRDLRWRAVQVPLDQMDHHLRYDCRYRYVYCPIGCGEVVWFATAGTHKDRECPKRLVRCRWGCGDEVIAMDIAIHESSQCLHRPTQFGR
jgi:hypothetical protein